MLHKYYIILYCYILLYYIIYYIILCYIYIITCMKYVRALAGNGLCWGRTERIRVPGVNHAWRYTRLGLLPTWRSRKLCFWAPLSNFIAKKKFTLRLLDVPGIFWKFVQKYIYLSISKATFEMISKKSNKYTIISWKWKKNI